MIKNIKTYFFSLMVQSYTILFMYSSKKIIEILFKCFIYFLKVSWVK
jgi:hypothetical protein